MGEDPFRAHDAETQLHLHLYPPGFAHPGSPLTPRVNGANTNGLVEEEDYTIRCICGYPDDDGNTVLCEQCNTWQHIVCYYPPPLSVPEVHKCALCSPRSLDAEAARDQQRRRREPQAIDDERRQKRPSAKSHKKSRTRDLGINGSAANGWHHPDSVVADYQSGSPKDSQHPAKRPKLNHKTTNNRSNNDRHRSDSNNFNEIPPSKIPLADYPANYYSTDFIRVHRENDHFLPAQANLHSNIGVTNQLSTWLDDIEAFSLATNGRTHENVFKHFPQPIEELESPVEKHIHEDQSATFHNHHPRWPHVRVNRDVSHGDFVGELKGVIGLRDDYKKDPANEWHRLRHPDHFVFFHPDLPIYIDCRSEGTLLRYIRRSCRPNIKLETIITGAREYRFCFTALRDILKGTEITVQWETKHDPRLMDCLDRLSHTSNGAVSSNEAERAYAQGWSETVLSHFGGCACEELSEKCLLGHYDHRLDYLHPETLSLNPKSVKRKRPTKKWSPGARGANPQPSRATSEAAQPVDEDDEMDDGRSASRSSRSRTSRDGTPGATPSRDAIGNGFSSEREKRKMIIQERLFEKLDKEEQQEQRKKKRTSGSNLNTPSLPTTKPSARNGSASNPNTPGAYGKPRLGDGGNSYFSNAAAKSPSEESLQLRSPRRASPSTAQPRPRAMYVETSTQTALKSEDNAEAEPPRNQRNRRPTLSSRLLRLAHVQHARMLNALVGDVDKQLPQPSSPADSAAVGELHRLGLTSAGVEDGIKAEVVDDAPEMDMDMDEAERAEGSAAVSISSDPPAEDPAKAPLTTERPLQTSHPPIKPPAPPWPPGPNSPSATETAPRANFRSTNLHVELPPPQSLSPTGHDPTEAVGPLSAPNSASPDTPSHTVRRPGPVTVPLMSSAHSTNSITQPSPIKKRMSLRDYVSRKKAETPALEKTQAESQAQESPPATLSAGGDQGSAPVVADLGPGVAKSSGQAA